jgi:ABC-type histidine transport system ATPase subunit
MVTVPSYLLSLGIENVTTRYTSSTWTQGLGQPRSGTIISVIGKVGTGKE